MRSAVNSTSQMRKGTKMTWRIAGSKMARLSREPCFMRAILLPTIRHVIFIPVYCTLRYSSGVWNSEKTGLLSFQKHLYLRHLLHLVQHLNEAFCVQATTKLSSGRRTRGVNRLLIGFTGSSQSNPDLVHLAKRMAKRICPPFRPVLR